ncbi:hypothetical protein Desaci_0586 [Desulfosporosinus acidiphilus SJ4]|uniref:Haemolysin XhlA n=2 Tax=Desulfosporosinus TaxID=79206 RepID=I4D1H4_DESAJ|nr:hypothetical protein Desaci_0586 [Desulfosporosinus acidiphilus SJ4]
MGDMEIQTLKEVVMEIKGDVKEVKDAVARLHLLMVENYVTRKEFEAYKEQELSSRRWWVTFVVGAATVAMAVINVANHFLSKFMTR